jgi:hypothetical protein
MPLKRATYHVTLNKSEINLSGLKQLKIVDGTTGGKDFQREIMRLAFGCYGTCEASVITPFLSSRQRHSADLGNDDLRIPQYCHQQ